MFIKKYFRVLKENKRLKNDLRIIKIENSVWMSDLNEKNNKVLLLNAKLEEAQKEVKSLHEELMGTVAKLNQMTEQYHQLKRQIINQ